MRADKIERFVKCKIINYLNSVCSVCFHQCVDQQYKNNIIMLSSRSLSRVVLRLKNQNRCLSSASNIIVKSLYGEVTVPDCSITDFCFENSKKWLNKTAVVCFNNYYNHLNSLFWKYKYLNFRHVVLPVDHTTMEQQLLC